MTIVSLDALAVRDTKRLVSQLTPDQFPLPTPCAEWDLGMLLTHMTVQHRGFAAAASGSGSGFDWALPAGWLPDPVRDYEAAADLVLDAFAAPGVLDREFMLPEISTSRAVPGSIAVGFHLVDYVVHGWDVAVAAGLGFAPDAALLAAALPIARAVPTGAARLVPGAAFAPALDVRAGADPLTEILLLLGRKVSEGAATKDA
jgi:uncharacterized protein (TIGR03086 family)